MEQIYDPMITFLRVLKFISLENLSLFEVKEKLPKSNIQNISIHCTTEEKAAVMRMLSTDADPQKVEMIDGVKIFEDDSWVLILPDATQPLIHLYAEGPTTADGESMIDKYTVQIKKYKSMI